MSSNGKQKVQNQHTQAAVRQDEHSVQAGIYQGPLPPPTLMEAYRNIDSTYPERIMREFELNSAHIRDMNVMAQKSEIERDRRGQWMAFVLSFIILAITIYAIYANNNSIAYGSGFVFLAMMVRGFLTKSSKD